MPYRCKRGFGPEPKYPLTEKYMRPQRHRQFITVAGPCSIETPEQMEEIAQECKKSNVSYLRGGPWTFGTYPPQKPGLREHHLELIASIGQANGLSTVVECLDVRTLDKIAHYADAVQIGARHMQDYALLLEASQLPKTVFLKRATNATKKEMLGAVEYLLSGRGGASHCKPVIVERGSVSFLDHVRWELSMSIIADVKEYFDVPIIVDASHGSGRRDLVKRLCLAGVAAGADGLLVETHPRPDESKSDAEQAYPLCMVSQLIQDARELNHSLYGVKV